MDGLPGALFALWIVGGLFAGVIFPVEAEARWPSYGGPVDAVVTVAAVAAWPLTLLVVGWFLARNRYRTWRHPREELSDGS